MSLFYWILEYAKVNIAYMILMFVWPSIIFHRFLKGRSFTFRFMFCPIVSIIILNTSVLLLGLVHILNVHVFRMLFYGSILVSFYVRIPNKKEKLIEAGRVLAGSYGVKQMFLNLFRNTFDAWHKSRDGLRKKIDGHKLEYGLLVFVIIFGMIYFTYGSFQDHSFGFGDMYPHSSWIYGLVQGQIFSAGIYPEGMHCFVYAMHVLFGIRLFSCMLYTAGVHVLVILISAYVFFKEIFRSRFTPIFALAVFLTIDALCIDEIFAMSRMQWTIPQEFGLFTTFICGAALIRYLKTDGTRSRIRDLLDRKGRDINRLKKLLYNDELILFAGALAASIIIHFYDTGIAFFLCVAIVPVFLLRIFNYRRFIPLVASVIAAVIVSMSPMVLAYASGIPLQGSIGWAMNVINGVEGAAQGAAGNVEKEDDEEEDKEESEDDRTSDDPDIVPKFVSERPVLYRSAHSGIGMSRTKPASSNAGGFSVGKKIYSAGYATLYNYERGNKVVLFTILAFVIFAVCKAGNVIYVLIKRKDDRDYYLFDGYFILALASVIFMVLYSAGALGLPNLFAPSRLCLIEQFLVCAVLVLPLDVLFWIVEKKFPFIVASISGIVISFAIYVFMIVSGNFHGYLYCEFTRYNSVVNVTESIISNMEKQKYTIVSPVDELYHVIEYGYHEELVQFINDCVEKDYTLPTEYVFIFFEKKPMKYAQFNFFDGPGWLAEEKYVNYYDDRTGTQHPYFLNSTASPEIAVGPFYKFPVSSQSYNDWITRTVLESRMLKWINDFNDLYPNELHLYYEDELFACYYFHQNPACLYQLGFEVDDSRPTTEDKVNNT